MPASSRSRPAHTDATATPSLLDAYQAVPGNDRWWRWLATATAGGWDGSYPPEKSAPLADDLGQPGRKARKWQKTLAAIQPTVLSDPIPPPKLTPNATMERLLAELEQAEQHPQPTILQAFEAGQIAAQGSAREEDAEPGLLIESMSKAKEKEEDEDEEERREGVPEMARRETPSAWARLEEVAEAEQRNAAQAAAAATVALGENVLPRTGTVARNGLNSELARGLEQELEQAEAEPKPESLPIPEPKLEPELESEPALPQPEPKPEPQPEPEPEPEPMPVDPEPVPVPVPEPEPASSDYSSTEESSDYSSTDSDDEDENSDNRQACRRIFEHIDADSSGLVELDEVLDSWQQCAQVRHEFTTPVEACVRLQYLGQAGVI